MEISELLPEETMYKLQEFKKFVCRKPIVKTKEIVKKSEDGQLLTKFFVSSIEANIGDELEISIKKLDYTLDNSSELLGTEVIGIYKDESMELEKGKVYLKPGESAPEGVAAFTGKRGKRFYISRPAIVKPKEEKDREAKEMGKKRTKEEQDIFDIQHEQSLEAREQAKEEQGLGRFEEEGPREVPWWRKTNTKMTMPNEMTTQYEKGGLKIQIVEGAIGWSVVENGVKIGTVHKEKDAERYAENKFSQLEETNEGNKQE